VLYRRRGRRHFVGSFGCTVPGISEVEAVATASSLTALTTAAPPLPDDTSWLMVAGCVRTSAKPFLCVGIKSFCNDHLRQITKSLRLVVSKALPWSRKRRVDQRGRGKCWDDYWRLSLSKRQLAHVSLKEIEEDE